MKRPSLLALTIIILALALVACERPAPTGDVPTPAGDGTPIEILPAVTPDIITPIDPSLETETAVPTEPTAENGTASTVGEGSTPTETGDTPIEVTEEPTAAVPPLADGVYVVKSGDTLGQIAFIYNVSVEDIMAANGLTNPNVLDVGDELTIPDAGFADTAVDSDSGGTTGAERIHIVQPGDNLFRIGQLYGFTVDELAEYNSIVNINSLDVGQEIRIPPSSQ